MKKEFVIMALAVFPAVSIAANENNIGSCGVGSKLFQGQKGIAPQVLGATTNGVSSNTVGITFGTSGCTQDGMVTSNWKTALFIDGNKERLARDMSVGDGETLDALAKLLGVHDEHKANFFRATKENFGTIFASESASTDQVLVGLKQVLAANTELSGYSTQI